MELLSTLTAEGDGWARRAQPSRQAAATHTRARGRRRRPGGIGQGWSDGLNGSNPTSHLLDFYRSHLARPIVPAIQFSSSPPSRFAASPARAKLFPPLPR